MKESTTRRLHRGLVLAVLALTACAPSASDAIHLAVELTDSSIGLASDRVGGGSIAFDVVNRGSTLHEIEVFSGAVEGPLPPVRNSIADMSGYTLLDEVEDILAGGRASLVVDLAPGTYLVICNLPGHYALGMWAYLTVTESTGA